MYQRLVKQNISRVVGFLAEVNPITIFLQGLSINDVCTLGGGVGSGKSGQMQKGRGGRLAKSGRPLGKKIHSYHIFEIYSDNLAVCLYIKLSLCLYSIEMCGMQCNDLISNIVFIRMFYTLFSNKNNYKKIQFTENWKTYSQITT